MGGRAYAATMVGLALVLATAGCVERQSLHDAAVLAVTDGAGEGGSPFDAGVLDQARAGDAGAGRDSGTPMDSPRDAAPTDGGATDAAAADAVKDVAVADVPIGGADGAADAVSALDVSTVARDAAVVDVARPDVGADATVARDSAADAANPCSSNPCTHGTCTATSTGFSCACSAGWGGSKCDSGSCTTLTCPSATTCRVPIKDAVAVCHPSACAGAGGLCMAENSDGSGDAVLISGRNGTFADLGSDWRNRARYFGYLDQSHSSCVCVFPQIDEGGTPLIVSLGQVKTRSSGFGQSNSWENPPTCVCP